MADSNYKFAPPCRENAPEWRTFMVLFKMELYKICHKKIFALGVICIPVFVLLSFFLNLHDTIWFGETGTLSGWVCFTGTYSVGMILTSILILCLISPVFAGEAHTRMKSISFTTREGPAKDAHAKLAASFTVSVGLWFMTSVFTLLPYLIGCGLDTLSHTAGPVMGWNADANFAVLTQPFGVYLAEVVLLGLFAAAQLCAITLCISAHARSPFYVVCTAALCWSAPLFGLLVLHGVYRALAACATGSLTPSLFFALSITLYVIQCSLYAAPLYLVLDDILIEATSLNGHSEMQPLYIMAACACAVLLLCTLRAYRRYRRI